MPVPTDPRLAYDRDGTVVVTTTSGTPTSVSASDVDALNLSHNASGVATGGADWLVFVLPTPVTLTGLYLAHDGASDTTMNVETSLDTTTGGDGTWTAHGTIPCHGTGASTDTWRTGVDTGHAFAANAVRISPGSGQWRTVHMYATATPATGLAIVDAAMTDWAGAALDWGVAPQASSADSQIVVANRSALSAQNVAVSVEAADATGFDVTHLLSTDGRTFGSSLTIPLIGPLSRSPVITVRRVTPAAASVGVGAARIVATAGAWV